MKSQPEVSLSQDMFNFEPMDHTLAAIHIPSNTISLRGSDQVPSFDAYGKIVETKKANTNRAWTNQYDLSFLPLCM
jgi:hypothetical protein